MMEAGNRKILVYQPASLWVISVLAVVLLVGSGYLLFERGVRHAGTQLAELERAHAALTQELAELRRGNAGLQQQLAVTERSSEIDRQAALEVRDSFAGLQAEILELRKELAFYRGIVSPGDARAGLNIQRFELQPGTGEGLYRFNIMLTQVRHNEKYVRGIIEMDIEGMEDGRSKRLPMSAVIQGDRKALKYKFRYFQDFDGEIRIPEGFEPERITLRLVPSGKGKPSGVEKTLEWPA